MTDKENRVRKRVQDITAKGIVRELERDVQQIADEMLAKTKDVIYIKNEVKQTFVSNKNPSSKDIISHYIDKLKNEMEVTFERKRKTNEYLNMQVEMLKADNQDLTNRIILMKTKMGELETQFGKRVGLEETGN